MVKPSGFSPLHLFCFINICSLLRKNVFWNITQVHIVSSTCSFYSHYYKATDYLPHLDYKSFARQLLTVYINSTFQTECNVKAMKITQNNCNSSAAFSSVTTKVPAVYGTLTIK